MIQLRIGNNIYNIPSPKENPSWGEDLTEWIVGINEAVSNLFGNNDIPTTSANIANNQTTEDIINGLQFNVADLFKAHIDYYIIRTYDAGSSVSVESGTIEGHYDGSIFSITQERLGDSGVVIEALNSGQFVYTSSDLPDHVSSIIRFKANTIST